MSCTPKGNGLIKPFPDGNIPLQPYPADKPLQMDPEAELPIRDAVASDSVKISGTEIIYYSLDVYGSQFDPLYKEPIRRAWNGPFKLNGYVEMPTNQRIAREFGSIDVFESSAWLARIDVENARMPVPAPGDVLGFWNIFFFDKKFGINGETNTDSVFYFDVLNVSTDGHIYDSPLFVGFKLTIKRNTAFTAERRLLS